MALLRLRFDVPFQLRQYPHIFLTERGCDQGLRHCLRLDLPFHKTHTPGELIERIDGDVTLLANFFSQFTINILGNALLVAGILA
jgi:ABC-type multidrug transport system fused ATPase/permease subunit